MKYKIILKAIGYDEKSCERVAINEEEEAI